MAANLELVQHTETTEQTEPLKLPSLNLEGIEDPETRELLKEDEQWLLDTPRKRHVALRLYANNPHLAGAQSRWPRLTNPENRFTFDEDTEEAIWENPAYRTVFESMRDKQAHVTAADRATLRVLRLRLFLDIAADRLEQRGRVAQPLGKTSLEAV